jgi:YD repeat-containing protein
MFTLGKSIYQDDANGNMITRIVGGQTYNLSYDPENRLVGVSGATTATFTYDGDGVKAMAGVS